MNRLEFIVIRILKIIMLFLSVVIFIILLMDALYEQAWGKFWGSTFILALINCIVLISLYPYRKKYKQLVDMENEENYQYTNNTMYYQQFPNMPYTTYTYNTAEPKVKTLPNNTAYIETENGIVRADGKPFTDEDVPYLIERSYEKSKIKERELAKVNPKLRRTEYEDELSFNFFSKYSDAIPVWEQGFQDMYGFALREKDLTKKIMMLEEAARVFIQTRDFFYRKGKGGQIYFQDMWERMHNSQNPCFSYLDLINEAIKEAKEERDYIIPDILETIRNNDGILQKDIYNMLPHISKEEIQNHLRHFEYDSIIIRVKKGNSYELHIK